MYNTSNNYKNKIYSDSTRHQLKIFLDDTEVPSKYILDFQASFKVFDSDEFSFGSTCSRTVKIKLHKDALKDIENEITIVKITTGINGEEIPYGEFTIDSQKEANNYNVEFELIDYMPRFNFNYDAKVTFPAKLCDIAKDICMQAGVELRFYFFFEYEYRNFSLG